MDINVLRPHYSVLNDSVFPSGLPARSLTPPAFVSDPLFWVGIKSFDRISG